MSEAGVDPAAAAAWSRHLGEPAGDPLELRRRLSAGSLSQAFAATAERAGGRAALTIGGETLTHAELDARAAAIGGWLAAEGVRPGDRVVLAGRTSQALAAAYLGTLRRGATAIPTDPQATAEELAGLLADAEPAAAFADAEPLERLASLGPDGGPRTLVSLTGSGLGASLPEAGEAAALEPAPADAPALLGYTSGTTGKPKWVPLSHGNVLASIRAAMLAWRWTPEDVLVHSLPLSHQHGLGGLHATLVAGSHAVLEPGFDPERLCDVVRDCAASVLMAVPTIYRRLSEWQGIDAADTSSLRLAISGSAALPSRLAIRASEWLGELPLERYGSTEAGLVLSNLYDGPRHPGQVGQPLPGIEVRLIGDGGETVASGAAGEIVIRGPQVFDGYLGRPEASAEAFTDDGWFRSGDIARLDPETGAFEITGRSKEMIVSGGLNVFPREVENVLDDHPAVARSAVAGVPSERWGEEVVAFVVAVGDVDPKALEAHCRERLSPYKCPKRTIVVAELPTNEMGKVLRERLVEIARGRDVVSGSGA